MPQLLTRFDLAIAKALTEGIRTDEVNPIYQQYIPKKLNVHIPILCGHFRTHTTLSMRSRTNPYLEAVVSASVVLATHKMPQWRYRLMSPARHGAALSILKQMVFRRV